MKRVRMVSILLGLLLAGRLGAESAGAPTSGRDEEAGDWLFRWDVRLWGADAALGYRGWRLVEGLDTVFWLSAGGGYQSANYYPLADDDTWPGEVSFRMLSADWRLGVSQGILYFPPEGHNLLEAVFLYRGKLQEYLESPAMLAGLADCDGLLQNSLLLALVFDSVLYDRDRVTRDGLYGVLSAELVPGFLLNGVLGDSRYTRLTAMIQGFRTLHSSDAASIYLADRLIYDHLLGEEAFIPFSARAAFGGLTKVPISSNPFRGLGGALRGVAGGRFDGFVKAANNLDLRVHFPAWTLFGRLTPGLVAYLDAGIYDRAAGRLSFDPVYAAVGGGVLLNGLTYDFILYGDYFLNEGDFSVSLSLGAHF
jgi:hypothetical protein